MPIEQSCDTVWTVQKTVGWSESRPAASARAAVSRAVEVHIATFHHGKL